LPCDPKGTEFKPYINQSAKNQSIKEILLIEQKKLILILFANLQQFNQNNFNKTRPIYRGLIQNEGTPCQ